MNTLADASPQASARLLGEAVHRSSAFSLAGLHERAFTFAFRGLVYPQIWEDPRVDLEALELTPRSRIVTIASGGCNVMSYLTGDPDRIVAVDLNATHVALNKLKLAALKHLPDHASFFRFFGAADTEANVEAYDRHLRDHLDEATLVTADVVRSRLEKLACDFDLADNYFAWQAFNRAYAPAGQGPLPPYLQADNFAALGERAHRVRVELISMTEYLANQPAASLDRYVLLDAQDWMSTHDLTRLWQQITRTARPGARVIFRTAAEESVLPGRLPKGLLSRWRYAADRSKELGARDRSAIYGGFHLYVLA